MLSRSEFAIDPAIALGEGKTSAIGKTGIDGQNNEPEIAVSGRLEAVRDRLDAQIMAVLLWDEPEISLICRQGVDAVEAGPLDPDLVAKFCNIPLDYYHVLGHSPHLARLIEKSWGCKVNALICLPLRHVGEPVFGVAIAVTKPGSHGFDSGDSDFFDTAVDMLSLAIANARARRVLDVLN